MRERKASSVDGPKPTALLLHLRIIGFDKQASFERYTQQKRAVLAPGGREEAATVCSFFKLSSAENGHVCVDDGEGKLEPYQPDVAKSCSRF